MSSSSSSATAAEDSPVRRLQHLHTILSPQNNGGAQKVKRVCIGNVCVDVHQPKSPEKVPIVPLVDLTRQDILSHLHWLLTKDTLSQDVFLIGPPGPLKRHLALTYAWVTRREVEWVCLSRDTSAEGELKQRREIVEVEGGRSAVWVDGVAVRAAVEGRVLVIEGIEKAERNVLPVLNNLLENREMNLEDGRHIIHPARYDALLQSHTKQQLDEWKLVRASEKFRVVAIGVPVPPYTGNPLGKTPLNEETKALVDKLRNVVQTISYTHEIEDALSSKSTFLLPKFPQTALGDIADLVGVFRAESADVERVIERVWPMAWVGKSLTADQRDAFRKLMAKFEIQNQFSHSQDPTKSFYTLTDVRRISPGEGTATFKCTHTVRDAIQIPT
ncbi:von Willebrand factor A domain-containing protein 8, partial [Borealophlyctis nickersoniae]